MRIDQKFEKRIIDLIVKYRFRIYTFCVLSAAFLVLPSAPYLNIFVTYKISVFFIIISLILLFNLSFKFVFVSISILFLACLFYQLLNQIERADLLGDYIFGIIFIELVKYVFSTYKKTAPKIQSEPLEQNF